MATTRLLSSPAHHNHQNHGNSHQAFYQEKVFVALENVDIDFDLKGRLIGPNNAYLGHIQLTGARCWLRGKGSGYLEPESGREAFEALHIQLQHPSPSGLNQAKLLAENLVQTVHHQYYQWRESRWQQQAVPPPVSLVVNQPPPSLPPVPPPVSMPISSCGGVFAVPPIPAHPCQIVLPPSLPPTTTQLIITDHSVTGAPTQQQVVFFKQEPPTSVISSPGQFSLSSSPPLLQETITTTTTTTYYFPHSAPIGVFPGDTNMSPQPFAPIPPSPIPPVSYPLAMLPPVVLPVPHPPPVPNFSRMNRWDNPAPRPLPASTTPILYNPPISCPPPVRPPGAASTFLAWSADFPHQQHLRCASNSSPQSSYQVEQSPKHEITSSNSKRPQSESKEDPRTLMPPPPPARKPSDGVLPKRMKSNSNSMPNSNFKSFSANNKPDAVVVKKTSALSSLAVAYNGNDNDE